MPSYRCLFLREDGQVARIEELNTYDNRAAHRDAVYFLTSTGGFSGFELWREGRKVDEYRPIKPASPPDAPDPRTDEVEAKLYGLAPAEELAYRYLLRDHSRHCRQDPVWNARIAELEGRLDAGGRARARALAADLTWTLTENL
jgi:hypothetical protein